MLWTELRMAYRALRARPALTLLSIISAGIAVATCVLVFGLWDAVFLRALPYPDSDRLVHARTGTSLEDESGWTSEPDFLDYRRLRGPVFEDFAALSIGDLTFRTPGQAHAVTAAMASAEFLPLLGARPLLGRVFAAADDLPGAAPVVVVGHRFWTTHLGADSTVVGSSILLDDVPHSVLGVLGEDFALYLPDAVSARQAPDVWTPLRAEPGRNPRTGRYLFVIGKIGPGTTLESARQRAAEISSELQRSITEDRPDFLMRPVPLRAELVAPSRGPLAALLVAVMVVLLIACVNVGGLMVELQSRRHGELVTRVALGASRIRLARQLVAEVGGVALAAAVLGIALALVSFDLISPLIPSTLPRVGDALLSPRVLSAIVLLIFVVVALIVWRPLVRLTSRTAKLAASLRTRDGSDARGRPGLVDVQVVAQIALSTTLLAGCALALQSAANLLRVDLGFDTARVLTFQVTLPEARYPTPVEVTGFFRELRERLVSLPWVSSVGYSNAVPLSGGGMNTAHGFPGSPFAEWEESDLGVVSEGYFEALGAKLVSGRTLTAADGADSLRRVVIDESVARRLWPEGRAVGRTLGVRVITGLDPFRTGDVDAEIVGVVRHLRSRTPTREVRPQVYVPHGHIPFPRMRFALRTADPAGSVPAVRASLHELDATIPLAEVRALEGYRREATSESRFLASFLFAFAGLGAGLAGLGVFSLVTFRVTARVRELGLRMALGASRRSIVGLVLRRGLMASLVGIALGTGGSLFLGRLMEPRLFGVSPSDPPTLVAVAVVALGLTLVASWVPSVRAASVDPRTCLTERV